MASTSRLALFACFVVFALLLVSSHVAGRELSENTVDTSKPADTEVGDAKWGGYGGYGGRWGGGWGRGGWGGYPGGGWGHGRWGGYPGGGWGRWGGYPGGGWGHGGWGGWH